MADDAALERLLRPRRRGAALMLDAARAMIEARMGPVGGAEQVGLHEAVGILTSLTEEGLVELADGVAQVSPGDVVAFLPCRLLF